MAELPPAEQPGFFQIEDIGHLPALLEELKGPLE
jgi:hypothetical protein